MGTAPRFAGRCSPSPPGGRGVREGAKRKMCNTMTQAIEIINRRGRRTWVDADYAHRRPRVDGRQATDDRATRGDQLPVTGDQKFTEPTTQDLRPTPGLLQSQAPSLKPKIVHVLPWAPGTIGGVQRMIDLWLEHCAAGWDAHVVCPGPLIDFLFRHATAHWNVNEEQADECLRRLNPDVLVHHGPHFSYGRFVPANGAVIWVVHGGSILENPCPAWAAPQAVFTNYCPEKLHPSWPPLTALPLGVDLNQFQPRPLVAGLVGRIGPEKIPPGFLNALHDWEPGPWRLRIIGQGVNWPWIKRVQQATADRPWIEFAGDVSPDDMPAEYHRLDAVLVPSSQESGGYQMCEAMAAGLPVIARRVQGLPFQAGDGALLVDTDEEMLAALRLFDSPEHREYFGRLARREAEARHGLAAHLEAHTAAYAAALAPEVSILCPVFNTPPDYLRECWESIKTQTLKTWELILVDDGSTDAAAIAAVNDIGADPRVKLIRLDTNRGISAALNAGLAHCRAEWVARMDADDVMLPDRMEKQLGYLRGHPRVDVLGGQLTCLREGVLGESTSHDLEITAATLADPAKRLWFVNHPTVMLRKSVLTSAGGYDERLRRAEDLDLWLRLLRRGAVIHNLPDVIVHYRIHAGQITGV